MVVCDRLSNIGCSGSPKPKQCHFYTCMTNITPWRSDNGCGIFILSTSSASTFPFITFAFSISPCWSVYTLLLSLYLVYTALESRVASSWCQWVEANQTARLRVWPERQHGCYCNVQHTGRWILLGLPNLICSIYSVLIQIKPFIAADIWPCDSNMSISKSMCIT